MARRGWALAFALLAGAWWFSQAADQPSSPPPATEPAARQPALAAEAKAAPASPPAPEGQKELLAAVDALAAAFNRQDAKAVAAVWAEDAVYTSRDTDEQIHGRKAIGAAYQQKFTADPQAQLGIDVHAVRFVTPQVAPQVTARVAVFGADAEVHTAYLSLWKKVNGAWLLDSAEETEIPPAPGPHDHLAALDWLVGEWEDEGDGEPSVRNAFRWTDSGAFLVRSFRSTDAEGKVLHEGTQVSGWDPEHERIKTWLFLADGTFGEGHWVQQEEFRWAVHLKGTLADGRKAALTQTFQATGDDTLTTHIVGFEIDGELQPAREPVRMRRLAAAAEPDTRSPEPAPAEPAREAPQPEPPVDKPANKPANKPASPPANTSDKKASEKPATKSTEKAPAKP